MRQAGTVIKLRILRGQRPKRPRRAGGPPPRRRRILWGLAGVVALAALIAGHVAYWYRPALRAARPRPGFLPARLLASDELPFAVWMPYPHQNLGVLERATAKERSATELTAALARLAGVPEPSLPAFGNLRVPPSTEIAFAFDEGGERFALAAEVYPVVAAFAKLAGRLADNPWLSGGVLTVEGRRVEVAWHGRVWTVASPSLPALADAPPGPPEPPCLLALRVRRANPPFPAGRYHLVRDGDDLVLASAGAPPDAPELEEPSLADMGLFLLVVSGGSPELGEPMQAMAFFARDRPVEFSRQGVSYELPGMACLYETGGGKRWRLPGESLLEWSGRKARGGRVGRFHVAAVDARSLRRIRELAPGFAPLVREHPGGRLLWGLWLDLETSRLELSRIAQALEGIPIVSPRHRERWRDAATVLAPAARRYSKLSVVVTGEPRAVWLRFTARASETRE